MITLKCPNCAANLTLDDSREFGFCQYCGTKIQLVQRVVHSGRVHVNTVQPERQKMETAKTLMELGEYAKAHQVLDELTRNYPQVGEGWLYLAKLRYTIWQGKYVNKSLFGIVFKACTTVYGASVISAFDAWMQEKNIKLNTPEHARDAVLRYLTETREMTNARKLLGADNPVYKKMLSEFAERAQKDCQITLQQIKVLNNDPMCLVGLKHGSNSYYRHGKQLMEELGYDGSKYYTVTVKGCVLEHEIAMFHACGTVTRHYLDYIICADDQNVWIAHSDSDGNIFDVSTYSRRANSLQTSESEFISKHYGEVLHFRRKRHLCMMCGGPKGLLGCQNRCISQMR